MLTIGNVGVWLFGPGDTIQGCYIQKMTRLSQFNLIQSKSLSLSLFIRESGAEKLKPIVRSHLNCFDLD